jgi:sugar lactone lactonase YvrE
VLSSAFSPHRVNGGLLLSYLLELISLRIPWEISSKQSRKRKETMNKIPEQQTLLTGLVLGESPRWHDDRLWFSDWGAHEVIAVDLEGKSEVIARIPTVPFCIDWLPEGRLLIVSGRW